MTAAPGHSWTQAAGIHAADVTALTFTTTVNNADPADQDTEAVPPGFSTTFMYGYRALWWTWVPGPAPAGSTGTTLRAHGSAGAVYLQVYSADSAYSWNQPVSVQSAAAGVDTDPAATASTTFTVGRRYYVRVTSSDDIGQDLTLTIDGIWPDDSVHTPSEPYAYTLAPADVGVDAPAPVTTESSATPLAPIGIAVPGVRPAFTVTVDADRPGQQVEVQWSADATFATGAASAFNDAPAGLIDAQIAVQASTDLPDGIVYWRARITGAYGPGTWSGAVQFAVNSLEGEAVAAGSFTITAAAPPAPHLWYIDTDASGTDAGQSAVIIGTGFGATPAVMLGDLPCPVTEVLDVAADPANASAARIEPGVACTPAHQQLTITIPPVDPDHIGDALTVQREG